MLKIALAGNPNSGKTTLFNALTGSNQFVGNWPGVTVEKKEGKLKKQEGVIVTDLPGIYSLSPYTLEEVVARNYLLDEKPDVILNIVDATNIERNLYLTTQLSELGIPMVIALNMMDVVRKMGDKINKEELSKQLSCPVVEISALKEEGVDEVAEVAINSAKTGKLVPKHFFSGIVEHALAHIEECVIHELNDERKQRWYAIKMFERDEKVLSQLEISKEKLAHIENDIKAVEKELDDDSESIITNERYNYVSEILKTCYKKKSTTRISVTDKIDRVVTHRIWALPIFALIMFLVYFVSVTTVGTWVTDWTNDNLFGDGFHFLGIDKEGDLDYDEVSEEYGEHAPVIDAFIAEYAEAYNFDIEAYNALVSEGKSNEAKQMLLNFANALPDSTTVDSTLVDEETAEETPVTYDVLNFEEAISTLERINYSEPAPADYGLWVPGIPVLVENGLNGINCWDWLQDLILNGIVAGVGAVLGFVPQMLVLFLFLSFLEACGYMARIAFVLDRIFRHFGLSGKSFIPMLVGVGCSVPGIMASRTIENESDRKITIMTTSFIPCGAKLPFIALIAGAIFGGTWWIAPVAYFIGMASVMISGIILKKTKLLASEVTPFVMELPLYHMPTVKNLLRNTWERGWSFIKKAGTVILLSSIVIWFMSSYGFEGGRFQMVDMDDSLLAYLGRGVAWIFAPIGFGNWQSAVAAVTGLVAKENIVATLASLFTTEGITVYQSLALAFTKSEGFSFLVFNLLCAPCFAAMGAIKREMNSGKWTAFAITYQCVFAYLVAFVCYHFGNLFTGAIWNGTMNMAWGIIGLILSVVIIAFFVLAIIRPDKKKSKAVILK
ncbi:MAG: ferrous iron transport protein B [Clostridia bacterium]|nr:ferrous iron transport protein B [Clostridia bacterium]